MTDRSAPQPQGHYVPAKRHGDLIFVSGMTPRENGKLLHVGQVVPETPVETYRIAVELAAENALTAAKTQLVSGEQILAVLSLTVYVNAPAGYTLHSRVADFASMFLEEHAKGGVSSRAAIGVSSLPGGATFEVSIIAAAGR
ncbi:RidA family protein [Brucella lupini]|uniref:RidA family protein n=1 Tax=Brucella lupini TaxID=255457 RepID=UPI000B98E6F8|nr:RidA family protein [Brucella lupini]